MGPLYLWGGGSVPARVHMAGGQLTRQEAEDGCVLREAHLLVNSDPAEVAPSLRRRPCDFVEFHCMLVRTALLDGGALLDTDIHCVHEHIDLSLALEARGALTWFEPASVVNYQAFAPLALPDLPLYRARWSIAAAEHSIAAFCAKWRVLDDERSFGDVRDFVRYHVASLDPLRPEAEGRDREQPLRADELTQTRSALFDLALARGYPANDLAQMAHVYNLALVLLDGYRPCGRPFLNHLCGTAGVLLRYDFRVELVAAALLHAVYTHCPPHSGGPAPALAIVRAALGGAGTPLERRVRAYTLREGTTRPAALPPFDQLDVLDAEVLMLTAANEIDMHLSGEFRYSGRSDGISDELLRRIEQVAAVIGVPGLAASLAQARAASATVPGALITQRAASYRIGPDRRSMLPMASNVPMLLRED